MPATLFDQGFADHNQILYGHNPTPRMVAAEVSKDQFHYWIRHEDDSVESHSEPFRPWLITPESLSELGGAATLLDGAGFCYLTHFPDASAYQEARRKLRDAHMECVSYGSMTKQAMMINGRTLFLGMTMSDVVRMQLDIETTGLDGRQHRLLMIALTDNRGLKIVFTGSESQMLSDLNTIIRERDPDIIEGHNLCGFDMPFLAARAEVCRVRLSLGRDGSDLRIGLERKAAGGGFTRNFTPAYVYGRHMIDTLPALYRFDHVRGELTSFGLKAAARAYGISSDDRVELPRDQMEQLFESDPELVKTYALQDVEETGKLAELVTASDFYQCRMIPESYAASAATGTGEKINCLLVRAYLHAGLALPRPQQPRSVAGGYTEVRFAGVIDRVVKADVESLYPSLMLAESICPKTDRLGVFLPALRELTRGRLDAKSRMNATTGSDRHYWDGVQSSFKVLINSFYGYLGANPFYYNDFDAAGRITERGRELVLEISANLERTGSKVIEIDTDGVYFTPPESIADEGEERRYVEQIGSSLPQGIRLAFDGRYATMISLKAKNYVLYSYDGKRILKGASLRSRADERFGRIFLEQALDLLAQRKREETAELYKETARRISDRQLPIELLVRRERVTSRSLTSTQRARFRNALGGAQLGESVSVYEKLDGTLGRMEEYEPGDENTSYYLEKLYKFVSRLRETFGEDFDRLIAKPGKFGLVEDLQGTFEF